MIRMLRAEADECLKSSVGNDAYSDAFYVAHIVLEGLAWRLERAGTTEQSARPRGELSTPPQKKTEGE